MTKQMKKIVNGKQFLRMGNEWYQTALPDCNDNSVCITCLARGNCVFFKECHYMFLRDMED